jgi:hypothetical protein
MNIKILEIMKTKLFLTGIALIAITSFAIAQDPVTAQGQGNGRGRCNGTGQGASFVDANKDGKCDNFGTKKANSTGSKGKGACNGTGQGKGQGKGRNFVDANKNGACDTFEAQSNK